MRAAARDAPGHPGRREFLPLAVIGLVALLALALAASLSAASEEDLNRSQSVLRATQAVVSGHAVAMREQVKRFGAALEQSSDATRARWTDDVRRMADGAARLENLALILGNQAALIGPHPGQSIRTDLGFVHSAGDGLVAEANAIVAHGRSMRDDERTIADLARSTQTGVTDGDALLLQDASARLTDAGERTRRAGVLLQQAGSQLMRSLGR